MKLTRNQVIVHAALSDADGPLTAYGILDLPAVQAAGLKAPPTIYRALDGLLAKGLAHRIESLNAFVACCSAPHEEAAGFMICEKCGLTVEVRIEGFERPLHSEARKMGFRLHKTSLEMLGLCRDCRSIADL